MADGMEIPTRKESNCVRCRNHGMKIVLRGHKQYCPYQSCTCDKCRFTAEQQRQMRLQNAIRRAEAQERTGGTGRGRGRPTQSAIASSSSQPTENQQVQVHAQQQQQQQQPRQSTPEDKKMLFDCSSELLKKFRYPWEMMPIMYALSKYANGNIEEVLRKIDEGQYAVNEQLRLQTLNMYFGAAQQTPTPATPTSSTRECG